MFNQSLQLILLKISCHYWVALNNNVTQGEYILLYRHKRKSRALRTIKKLKMLFNCPVIVKYDWDGINGNL